MSLNIDGTCNFSIPSISGCPLGCTGCEEPVPTPKPCTIMCYDTVDVHFDQYDSGDIVLLFPGFVLSTSAAATNPLMIFDSAAPTVGQEFLGSPNTTIGGGPGIGAGGQSGSPGANSTPQKKILIISANPPTPLAPVANPTGGLVTFNFNESVNVCEVQLLNVTAIATLTTYDISNKVIYTIDATVLGLNSFQTIQLIGGDVRKLTINLQNDAGIAHVIYKKCKNPALPAVDLMCENWNSFVEGTNSSGAAIAFTGGIITSNSPGSNAAMIFNASIPTAGDVYLGTPNIAAVPPGPGIGAAGTPGLIGQNIIDLGKVVIISEDNNAGAPKANAGGQLIITFTEPVLISEMHFLNVDTDGGNFQLFDDGGSPIDVVAIPNLGANSFQKVASTLPFLTKQAFINFTGKAALTRICYYQCDCGGGGGITPVPDMISLPDNMMTQVPIPSTGLQGTFMLIVKSMNADGASATFVASKAFDTQLAGSIARLTSAPSLTGETVHITWAASSKLALYHDTLRTGGIGALVPYDVQFFTV